MKLPKDVHRNCILIIGGILGLFSPELHAQGCSDAGICSISGHQPTQALPVEPKSRFVAKFGLSSGKADHGISVWGSYLDLTGPIHENWNWNVKATTLAQTGNGISTNSFSDIYITSIRKLTPDKAFSFGVKIPMSDANKHLNGLPLPLDYQSSLGTLDMLIGYTFSLGKFSCLLAWQQPLIQNRNTFLAEQYPVNAALAGFQSTNQFRRSGDLLMRISYPIHAKSIFIAPGILPIFHLTNDKFKSSTGEVQTIPGSSGLTLNATLLMEYKLTKAQVLQLNAGSPLIARKSRPDGLTRSFVVNLEYRIAF